MQSLAFVLKERETKSRLLSEVEASIQPFVDNVKVLAFGVSVSFFFYLLCVIIQDLIFDQNTRSDICLIRIQDLI